MFYYFNYYFIIFLRRPILDLKFPLMTPKRRRTKEKWASVHTAVRSIILRALVWKKQIDMLTQLLDKNNISLPDCSKKREGGSNSEDKERVHVLVAGTSSSPSFIIDYGSSRHMVSTSEIFSFLDMSKGPPIVLGYNSNW